ncbi:hypothetical protein [Bullifex porci]|uniref:hypothetical protein n=1 Tax=Bullifex porci TaxID=2606638 RepID=UPI0023F3BF84|nr:hypothetical protein [Bullifex porci]MDD7254417.1 hypothetical protein [Bullifex porci]
MKKLILLITIMLIFFTAISCNSNNTPSVGGIKISINDGISRGIEPNISLAVVRYSLSFAGPDGQNFGDYISAGNTSYTKTDLLPGEWRIKAVALNESDQEIGICETSVIVTPGETKTVSMNVEEFAGYGTFTVNLTAPPSAEYTAVISKVTDGSLTVHTSENMVVQENGSYTASFSLMNGYYTLSFTNAPPAVSLPAPVAFRIVKGDTLIVSFLAESNDGGFNITINDNIVSTPVLTLTASPDTAGKGGTISVNASADEGTYAYQWYVDGRYNNNLSNTLQVSFTEAGSHEVSCIAADSSTGIIISAKTTVTVTEEE